jgi:hypothetical protein
MQLSKLNDVRFQVALNRLVTQQVPLRTAFKLKGIINKVNEELKKLEEVRQGALREYGTKTPEGDVVLDENGNVQFEPEKLELFVKELNDLGTTVVEIGTISLSELGDKVTLTADDAMALDGLLVE